MTHTGSIRDRAAAEKGARLLLRPFQEFFAREAAGSIVLLLCTAVALVWSNSTYAASYFRLWETGLGVNVAGFELTKTLHHWVNDGLMAVFFFVIGLEIKREILVGELASPRKAALPLAAAVGGMVVPALIYVAFNVGSPTLDGWAVPMATDIAFALGVLSLLGPRVPTTLKVFLAALAIVDDLGAVLVIAIFYTTDLSMTALGGGALFLAAMVVANRAGIRYPLIYALLGVGLWLAVLKSGVHATVAGVLGAMTIPASRRIDAAEFAERGRSLLDSFSLDINPAADRLTPDQVAAVSSLEGVCEAVETPLARLEHAMLPWVAFFIMPLFALANAGVPLAGGVVSALADPVAVGIIAGLVVGKPIGVATFAWAAIRLRLADMLPRAGWRHILGVASLCGIGFTMSLFISNLAFTDGAVSDVAKASILLASLGAGLLGVRLLRSAGRPD